jgi:hypothetical protein
MAEEHNKESKGIHLNFKEGYTISDTYFARITGSIDKGYSELMPTFNINQNRIADVYQLHRNVFSLNYIAEAMDTKIKLTEEQRDLALKQRDSAVKDAKKQIKLTYITIGIAVVIIAAVIILTSIK